MKKVSIIVPMYNSFHMMERNLNILLNQKACKIEFIIVDDCSTDNSYLQAVEYARNSKLDIKVIKNEKNEGPGYSRNIGLCHVTGDYVTFVDSDDYFSEDFTNILAPLLEREIDCVIFDYINVDENGKTISTGKTIDLQNVRQGFIESKIAVVYSRGTTWGKVYRKEVIFQHGICFANLYRNEDMPFTKYAIAMSETVYYCQAQLYKYVQNPSSLMHNNLLLNEENCQRAFAILVDNLSRHGFQEELLAIELREVLNNTVLIKVAKKENYSHIKQFINTYYTKKHISNKYFQKQKIYIKIISYCAYYKMIFALSLLWKYKQWKRNR